MGNYRVSAMPVGSKDWRENYEANGREIAFPLQNCQRRATEFVQLLTGAKPGCARPSRVASYPPALTSASAVAAPKAVVPSAQDLKYRAMAQAQLAGPQLRWPFWVGSAAALAGLVILWRKR